MILEKLPGFDQELETIVLFIAEDSPNRALREQGCGFGYFWSESLEKS